MACVDSKNKNTECKINGTMLNYLPSTNIHPTKTSFCYKEEISLFFRLFSSLFSSSSFSLSSRLHLFADLKNQPDTRLHRVESQSSLLPFTRVSYKGWQYVLPSVCAHSFITGFHPLTPLESVHGAIDPLLCFPLSSHQQ